MSHIYDLPYVSVLYSTYYLSLATTFGSNLQPSGNITINVNTKNNYYNVRLEQILLLTPKFWILYCNSNF